MVFLAHCVISRIGQKEMNIFSLYSFVFERKITSVPHLTPPTHISGKLDEVFQYFSNFNCNNLNLIDDGGCVFQHSLA